MNYTEPKLAILASIIGLLASEHPCNAGQPQPVSGTLGNGGVYEVPAGKILLLDCLSFATSVVSRK
jgi:hypothetical protein